MTSRGDDSSESGFSQTPAAPDIDLARQQAAALSRQGSWEDAAEIYRSIVLVHPSDPAAWLDHGNALYMMGRSVAALDSYDRSIALDPVRAEAQNNRGAALGSLLRYEEALNSYDEAIRLNPGYPDATRNRQDTLLRWEQLQSQILAYETLSSSPVPLRSALAEIGRLAVTEDKKAIEAQLDSLTPALRCHPAVCAFRNGLFARTASGGRDLVFCCVQSFEVWNPELARTRGIGGSEEAVVWLSRLLARRGWSVTVYCNCGAEERQYDGVWFKPSWMWNNHDRQDITVLWRYPHLADLHINSESVVLDLHDVIPESAMRPDRIAKLRKIFVKSKFHRALYPQISDAKIVVLPNGIDVAAFAGPAPRDPMLIVNTSSPDRSMAAFLDCFEEIRRQVPTAKAEWAYGWGVWDSFHGSDTEKRKWKTELQRRMEAIGVVERGKIGHQEVAQLYLQASIFGYPTEMAEIDCISLTKAMAAGAVPVTTDFAALGEKAGHGGVFLHSQKTKENWALPGQFSFEMTDAKQKRDFVNAAVKLLNDPPDESAREPMRQWARTTFDWERIADGWHEALLSLLPREQSATLLPEQAATLPAGSSHVDGLCGLGKQALHSGDPGLALELFERALRSDGENAAVHFHRGNALYLLQRYPAAIDSYSRAIQLNPQHAEAYNNRASGLNALGQPESAMESLQQATRINPGYADAHVNSANTLFALGRYDESLESSDRAVAFVPASSLAWAVRGNALYALQRYGAALESYDRALQLDPQSAEAHNNRGSALHVLLRHEEARDSFERAVSLNPEFADGYRNLGYALQTLRLYPQALHAFEKALQLKPAQEYLRGACLHLKRVLCEWDDSETVMEDLRGAVLRGERAAVPFALLPILDDPALHRRAAEIYVQDKCPPRAAAPPITVQADGDRIRIGYFSADYFNHATSYLMAELLERHDRTRFEIVGFSFGPETQDEMGRRVACAMDKLVDVRLQSDMAIAELSRSLQIDIAVDLKGFTRESRPGIFAWRAAPVQVSYLGYPGTMAAEYIDYLVADRIVVPESEQQHYSEKIVYLPDSYQVNDTRRVLPARPGSRREEGLPESGFVYCCFNTLHKIAPDVFASWMRILGRVEGSVLWLLEDNPWAAENLRSEARVRGVSSDRLVFAKPLPVAEHLGRHALADLFLDTMPYNAHTTASDALWSGLPVLTRTGRSFASRVAASLLHAAGLPELVTGSELEYENLAVALSLDPGRLNRMRRHLAYARSTAPLFDCGRFTAHLEAAYLAMHGRLSAGLEPDHIYVKSLAAVT